MKDIFLKLMFNTQKLHNYLPFLLERMKLGKIKKPVNNLHDITEYVIHIRSLKQTIKLWINFVKRS